MFWKRKNRRGLFKYWGGKGRGWLYGDPMAIVTRMAEDPELVLDRHLPAASGGDPQATQILANAVCRAFQVSQYDASTRKGLTIAELLELFFYFEAWTDVLKKNTSPSSTPPPSSESTSNASEEPTPSDTPLSALQQAMHNSGGKMWCGSGPKRDDAKPPEGTPPLSVGMPT